MKRKKIERNITKLKNCFGKLLAFGETRKVSTKERERKREREKRGNVYRKKNSKKDMKTLERERENKSRSEKT